MPRMAFQIDAIGKATQQVGLGTARRAGDHQQRACLAGLLDGFHQELAHGLVAARHTRAGRAGLGQPLLHDGRTQAAAEAVEPGTGMGLQPGLPAFESRLPDLALHQPVAQRDGGILTFLFVASADSLTLDILEQREVLGTGKGTASIFHGGSDVH